MKENDTDTLSLESLEFLFRHPWIIIYSIVVLVNLIHAYIYSKPLDYRSQAVLSFEMAGTTVVDKAFLDAKKELIGKVLLGDNINYIIKEVWNVDDKKEPFRYSEILDALREPKAGIRLQQDDKVNPNLLTVVFIDSDPKICYKVVQATVNAVIRENKRATDERAQATLSFLTKQLEIYKTKLADIEKEVSDIKSEFLEKFPELTERERDMVVGVTGQTASMRKEGALNTFLMYDEKLAQLNLEMLEYQKKKESLQKRLESGDVLIQDSALRGPQDDLFVEQYSKTIAAKEVEIADLVARGYKKDHPQIKKIGIEINRLKAMQEQRLNELRQTGSQFYDRATAIEKIKSQIGDMDFKLETLKSKIGMVEEYRRNARDQLKPREAGAAADIYEKMRRLSSLEKEKDINEGYYLDIRKQLEEAELKKRLEKAEAGFTLSVVEAPKVPVRPIPLQRIKYLFVAFIVASMIGVSLAYVIDSLDDSIRSGDELRRLLMVTVLATIDQINTGPEVVLRRVRRNATFFTLLAIVVATRIAIKIVVSLFYSAP